MALEPGEVGYSFERRLTWSEAEITEFARIAGDFNPLHHDRRAAELSRFGGLIASGSHTVAVLMAMCGSQASSERPGVGLEFDFKLLGPARPNEEMLFRWEITETQVSERPRGTIAILVGSVTGPGGRPIVSASARTLYFHSRPD